MNFDPAKTIAVVTAWPDLLVAPELVEWLHAVGLTTRQIRYHREGSRDVACAYNHAVRIALASPAEHFIFADNDIRPHPANTQPFLDADGPVVGCIYNTACERAFDDPRSIHTGLWRCDRSALEAIPPPWFTQLYTPDGLAHAGCVCSGLIHKFHAAGIPTVHAGWAGHEPKHKLSTIQSGQRASGAVDT